MFDAMADMMSVPLLHHDYAGRATPRTGLAHASIFPYGSVACADGEIVIVVQNPGEWRRLCTGVLERPDLIDDPRFADNPSRVENRAALGAILADIFAGLTRAEAIAPPGVRQARLVERLHRRRPFRPSARFAV